MTMTRPIRLCLAILALFAIPSARAASDDPPPPLSEAQIALFETPHLDGIDHPEALEYSYRREGPDGFADRVVVRVQDIHPDRGKYVSFDYLTGEHHVLFPAVDDFRGNPLLMLFLEHDVRLMKEQIGIAAGYLRDRIRHAFVDQAVVADTTVPFDGHDVAARRITLRPFARDDRFAHLPTAQAKTYTFVLSEAVPGMIVELRAETPADAETGAPAYGEQLHFTREIP
jgi:hypothetical protein